MFIELTKIFITDSKEYYKNNILADKKDYDEFRYKIIENKISINPTYIKAIEGYERYIGHNKEGKSHFLAYTYISLGSISYNVKETPEEINDLIISKMRKDITNKLNELDE